MQQPPYKGEMVEVTFYLSQEDIDAALPKSPAGCAVSIPIKRELNNPHVLTQHDKITIRGCPIDIPLPSELKEVTRAIDSGQKSLVKPRTFKLRLPKILLKSDSL